MSDLDYDIFCAKCGRKLHRMRVIAGFNAHTGEPIYHTIVYCPKDHWYDTHTRERFDEHGKRL